MIEQAISQSQNKWLGRMHHTAKGVVGTVTDFAGFIAAGVSAGGAVVVAGVIANAATVVGCGLAVAVASTVVAASGQIARALADKTKEHKHDIGYREQTKCRVGGGVLAVGFALACGAGVGIGIIKLADDQLQNTESKVSARPESPNLKQSFSVSDLKEKDCVVVFSKGNQPRIEQGGCTLIPQ
ncbi:MAG: hypothetical protein AUJ12_00755 [Alphaproteobacteria bacterium CG1_02_46_17]|nr:MAG: hypothetical protein AUJ12_00755 [Alphaproteobacteria bacterium CG1_02_46_17]